MYNTKDVFKTVINGIELEFLTNKHVFSPGKADAGTLAMLSQALPYLTEGAKVLDLGCGYGLAGIFIAKLIGGENVYMSDISEDICRLAEENARRNNLPALPKVVKSVCFRDIDAAGFDLILSNPPYHADFSVPKEMIEKGFNRLKLGGRLFMVTKRRDWYKNKLISVFGGVQITEADGYFVFCAERRGMNRVKK